LLCFAWSSLLCCSTFWQCFNMHVHDLSCFAWQFVALLLLCYALLFFAVLGFG
jgi:hypothetical protein